MTAKEYYNKTRLVETRNWTLGTVINFAEEYAEHYHKEEMNIGLLIKHLQEVLSSIETDPETAIELLITVIEELQLKQTK